MNTPGFTAGASLYTRNGHYQRRTTQVGPRGYNKVISQLREGEAAAQRTLNTLGIGQVRCQWEEYCEGRMPNIHCGIKEFCFWWPY